MLTITNTRIMKSDHRSYVVIGDTERFGTGRVLYESYKKADCLKYIGKHNTDYAGGVTACYEVRFDRLRNKRYEHNHMDVLAVNAKDACDQVLNKLYHPEDGRGFYPFHRTAKKIDGMSIRLYAVIHD